MKKSILLIFIALMTAMGCQAQEADATKTARYNNRHTMDGYKAFYEAGYFWASTTQMGRISLTSSALQPLRAFN
mgnify:CR=1 FL=1